MVILGIDPGTASTGFGVIQRDNKINSALDWGIISTDKQFEPAKRLIDIYKEMSKLIKKYKPDVIAIEKLFFATNAKTAIRVGQAQGVMLLCAARSNVAIYEYAPGTIKKIVGGYGRADKKDVQKKVRENLGSRIRSKKFEKTHFDNAADALAVALCHIKKLDII